MMTAFKVLFIFGFIAGTLLGAYALLIEPARIKVVNWRVQSEKWTNDTPLKIALITDVHAIWPWMDEKRILNIVERTNALNPDLILLLGDYVGDHPFGVQLDPEKGIKPYEQLSAKCGVFAVLGNHDFGNTSGSEPDWTQPLINSKITVLQNQAIKVECDNESFWVGGLEELWKQNADIQKTLAHINDTAPIIMAMHNPDSFVDIPNDVALSVAGHMHGGQIRLPFIGSLKAVLPSKYGKRFEYGHIVEDKKNLVVSGGLGMTGLPLRFNMPPEITIVYLEKK